MKVLLLPFIFSILVSGCASSEKNSNGEKEYSNLVSLNPPSNQKQEESNIYIDTVEPITQNNQKALLISGSFPDGCTHLKSATHTLVKDTLQITLEAWREPDMMCAQVLTSFSYIYKKFSGDTLEKSSAVKINGRPYQIN